MSRRRSGSGLRPSLPGLLLTVMGAGMAYVVGMMAFISVELNRGVRTTDSRARAVTVAVEELYDRLAALRAVGAVLEEAVANQEPVSVPLLDTDAPDVVATMLAHPDMPLGMRIPLGMAADAESNLLGELSAIANAALAGQWDAAEIAVRRFREYGRQMSAALSMAQVRGVDEVRSAQEQLTARAASLWRTVAWWLVGGTVLVLLASYYARKFVFNPLGQLGAGLRGLRTGEPVGRIAIDGPAELEEIAGHFNRVVDLIEESDRERISLQLRISRILEEAFDEILVLHRDSWRILQTSERARENLGFTDDEIQQLTFRAVVAEEGLETVFKTLEEGRLEPDRVVHTRFQRKDGSTYPVHARVRFSIDEAPPVIVIIARDVTRDEARERALRSTADRLNMVVQGAPLAILTLHPRTGRVLSWNETATRIFGWGASNAVGRVLPFVAERDRADVLRRLKSLPAREGSDGFEADLIRRDATRIRARLWAAPLRGVDGVAEALLAIVDDVTTERDAIEALARSEASLAEAQRMGRMGSWELDVRTGELEWSAQMHRLMGTDPEQGPPALEEAYALIHADDRADLRAEQIRLTQEGGSLDTEKRIVRPDGEVRTFRLLGESVADEKGVTVAIRGAVQDVTEARMRELETRVARDRLRAFFRAAPVGLALERGGVIAFVNQRLCLVTGRHRRDIIGRSAQTLWGGEPVTGPSPRLVEVGHPQLGVRSVLVTRAPLSGPGHDPGGAAYAFLDVTDRISAEQRFQATDAVLRAFMDNSDVAMYVKDRDGRYVMANRFLEAVLDLPAGGLVGRTNRDLFEPELAETYSAADREVLRSGRPVRQTEPDDRGRVFLSTKFPIRNSDGYVEKLGGVSVDVTDLERAQREAEALYDRLQAVREDERTYLAREIHDELGGTLTGVKIAMTRALRRGASADDVAARVRDLVSLLDETIARVRDISTRLRPGVLDELGLVPALEWLATDARKRTGLNCTVRRTPPEPPELPEETETHLFRIAQEGLTNAIRHAQASNVWFEIGVEGDVGIMRVGDDGVGFEPPSPNGDAVAPGPLGLRGMEERARLVGGTFEIEGAADSGTVLTVTFPLGPRG